MRTLLTWLVLVCLLPGVVGAVLLFRFQYQDNQSQQKQDTLQMTRALVQAVDHHLLRTQAVAQSLSTADSLSEKDFERFHRRAREAIALSGLGANVVLLDRAGRQVINTAVEYGQPLPQQPLRESGKKVFATGAPAVSDLFFGLPLKRPLMSVDVPVMINGKVAYALGVGVLPEHFNVILRAQNFPSHWLAAIFDSSGTIVGRTQSADKLIAMKPVPPLTTQMNATPDSSTRFVTEDGISVIAYYSQSPVTKWRVAVGVSNDALQSVLMQRLGILAAGIMALFVLGLVLAWFMGGRITLSVKALAAHAIALGNDRTVPVSTVHTKETVDVETAINRAATLLAERAVKLQTKEKELTEAHLLAKFGTWTWDVKTGVVLTSQSIPTIYVGAVPPFTEQKGSLLTVESWNLLNAAAEEAMKTGQAYDLELQVNHGQGGMIWINAKCEAVKDEKGKVVTLRGTIQDITDRLKAEQALRESESKFRTITDAIPQMVWSTRPDGYPDFYNLQWYAFTGVPANSTDGKEWNGVLHVEDQERAREVWEHSVNTGTPYEIEYRLYHHSGQYRWVLGRALPVKDVDDTIIRWMGTCTDIHERKLAQEALQEADQRKDEFLAMLAHELRNPLAPIASAAQLLQLAPASAERVQKTSEIISRQALHMTALIDDLLDVSRVTRGLVNLEKTALDLRQVVAEAVEQVRPLITKRRHYLTVQMPPDPATVTGEQKRLVQVVTNLLNNAAKYTPEGGSITVEVICTAAQITVSVSDNGVGMSPELREKAFELFTQGARTSDRSQGGLGIGLALVKSIIELHQGTVTTHSDGIGKGSNFIVCLPRLYAEASTSSKQSRDSVFGQTDKKLTILIVDDNADAAFMLSMFLETLGHNVFVEHGSHQALELAHREMPDVCILDIGLPEMDGYELARRLRAQPKTTHALLMAVTGYGQEKDKGDTINAGFDYHFVKPVDIGKIVEALADLETRTAH